MHVMNNQSHDDFVFDLIKGRIAETIFEQMFRETGQWSIFRSGYETAYAMLAQYQHQMKLREVIDQVRSAPDFVLISDDKTEAYFIEVKYRRTVDQKEMLKTAKNLELKWGLSHVFVVSHDGFYYENVHTLIRNKGNISKLSTRYIPQAIQEKYLALLHRFLP
jgi:hypothetical protein